MCISLTIYHLLSFLFVPNLYYLLLPFICSSLLVFPLVNLFWQFTTGFITYQLLPFAGHGLSYTEFKYSDIKVVRTRAMIDFKHELQVY